MAPKRKSVDGAGSAVTPTKKARTSAAAGGWTQVAGHASVYVSDYNSKPSAKIAGFDMDSTLIKTKSGKTFPISKDDWELWDAKVAPKVQELHNKGFRIVIITNQAGVSKGKTKLEDIQAKIDAVQAALDVPLLAMILTADDANRKPLAGPWRLMESTFNGGIKANLKASFYCGDAAGREPPTVKKKDFSAGDLKFALNVGVAFQTPEECFLGQKQKIDTDKFEFDPRELGKKPAKFPVPALKGQTLVLCVGAPGSGKSGIATQQFKQCSRVNQDTLKTKQKCLKACEDALKAGKSVVVDNQNKSKSDRAAYIALAKKANVPVIAIYCKVPKDMCFHLNAYRLLNTSSDLHRDEKVPSMVIHAFYKNVEEPAKSEGFQEVYTVGMEHFNIVGNGVKTDLLRSFLLG